MLAIQQMGVSKDSSKSSNEFKETLPNAIDPQKTKSPPPGMVWIPGGEFSMGMQEIKNRKHINEMTFDSRPVHSVYVDGFWIDKTEVTNKDFSAFVKATKYVTLAEKDLKAQDYPQLSADALKAGSLVYTPSKENNSWWKFVVGANWKHPLGPESQIDGKENFPVVHIAYEDALAYTKWAKKDLPTEAEWEFAARGGLTAKLFPWGDDLMADKKWQLNIFQGDFGSLNGDKGRDAWIGTAPVAQYAANAYGLYDVSGNVWEWVRDWYRPDYYSELHKLKIVAKNPQGPASSHDPDEPGAQKRVHRGGSFLCTEKFCSRYFVGARGKGEVQTASNHLGFRCVKRIPTK